MLKESKRERGIFPFEAVSLVRKLSGKCWMLNPRASWLQQPKLGSAPSCAPMAALCRCCISRSVWLSAWKGPGTARSTVHILTYLLLPTTPLLSSLFYRWGNQGSRRLRSVSWAIVCKWWNWDPNPGNLAQEPSLSVRSLPLSKYSPAALDSSRLPGSLIHPCFPQDLAQAYVYDNSGKVR